MALQEDLKGGTYVKSFDKITATRVFYVTGLTPATPGHLLVDALTEPNLPVIGANDYPGDSSIYVISHRPVDVGCNKARVFVDYSTPTFINNETPDGPDTAGVVEISATVQNVITHKNANGDQILLSHTFNPGTAQEETITTGVEAVVPVPQLILSRTRLESAYPLTTIRNFIATMNDAAIWGFAAKTLLCSAIRATKRDNDSNYNVRYEFQHKKDTWDGTFVFIDDSTGKPPEGLVDGEGLKTEVMIEDADFTALPVTF